MQMQETAGDSLRYQKRKNSSATGKIFFDLNTFIKSSKSKYKIKNSQSPPLLTG
jgi:hypothetical protein